MLRGAGSKAFVAGTDIAQFREFANGDDGVALRSENSTMIRLLRNRLHGEVCSRTSIRADYERMTSSTQSG